MAVLGLLVCIAITAGLSSLGPRERARMLREDVTFRVEGPLLDVVGLYVYRAEGERPWRPHFAMRAGPIDGLEVSGTVDGELAPPVQAEVVGDTVRYAFNPIAPGQTLEVRLHYRQRHLGKGAVYAAADAGGPIPEASYTIMLPPPLKLGQCTWPVRRHAEVGELQHYYIRLTEFRPEKDLMFHWVSTR